MAPANFDRVAGVYVWAEYATFGRALERTRNALLPCLPPRRQALVLGDGDGRFLATLLERQPQLSAIAVDTSSRMLSLLARRCRFRASQANPPALWHQSALTLAGCPPDTDLIVSHFFLDCLTQIEVQRLVSTLTADTAPGAFWLLSEFAVPTGSVMRPVASVLIAALYLAFRFLTGLRVSRLPAIAPSLLANGWSRCERRQFLGGLLYTELWHRP